MFNIQQPTKYNMKTLLQINSIVNSGSVSRITEQIGQVAIKSGWNSYIAYGRERNRPSKSNKIRIGSDFDIRLHGIQTRILDNHALGMSSRKATKSLIRKIDEIKPDIIHLHNLHGYYINVDVLFTYLSNINTPVIWTLHDCWSFTGHCAHFDYIGCEKWKTECYKCPLRKEFPSSYFLDRSKKNYRDKKRLFNSVKNLNIVTVSNWLKSKTSESFLGSNPIKVINNGLDTSIFHILSESKILKKKYNLEDKFIIIGVATAWGQLKGLYDYYKINEKLQDNEKIILIGLTPKQINELPEGIIGIERTDNIEELVEFYNMADIVLNISYQETFGMTTPEGFACGTPSIVYNATASPELISSKTGIVVEKGDIDGVISAIDKIKQKGKAYYADACRQRALDLYKKEDRFMDYINLYNELLKK